ncbi:TrbC/VirB2 family protein [Ochrobactrum sp. MR28]|uniref:TrbC/VirB2 family protein n=1 Tax=Pseudochrobactrum sp. AO18b TaxID=1201036 RepID=UPI0003A17E83|nr:TrbC/VirB2 family protein [Pseudochrobactrum sp. AO18b]MBX8803236.1 TrbC/VirB2 family protein [Ochrobactrum sp. MR28]MBX8818592.1 TrbC/VirB2 family protein [Ochrobactrum sp. MR31]
MLSAKNKITRFVNAKRFFAAPAAISAMLLLTENAYAQSNAFAPLSKAIQMIIDFITGPFGTSVAIIAVMGLGFLALAGRLSWIMAGGVILGIGIVFGAPQIVPELISAVGK